MHGMGGHWSALDHERRSAHVKAARRHHSADRRGFQLRANQRQPHRFNKEANKDVIGTLQKAIAKINALPTPPDFVLHTGDLSHLSEAEEFDALEQNLKSLKTKEIFYVPGEHDVLSDNGAMFRERFGRNSLGAGW